jgi:tetratricopeptide (TPR) repeat protein
LDLKIAIIHETLPQLEEKMGDCYTILGNFENAEICYDKAIFLSKRVLIKEKRITILFSALLSKCDSSHLQSKFSQARVIVEKCYNFVAEAYYPDYPMVLKVYSYMLSYVYAYKFVHIYTYMYINICICIYTDINLHINRYTYMCINTSDLILLELQAAMKLVDILIQTPPGNGPEGCSKMMSDMKDTEMYARIVYECLTRPVGDKSLRIGEAASSLANVTAKLIQLNGLEAGNIEEAEMLARKAIRIQERLYDLDHCFTVNLLLKLANILGMKKDYNDKLKTLFERSLVKYIINDGADSSNVAVANYNLALFHVKVGNNLPSSSRIENLDLALSYTKQAVRIGIKTNGPAHPKTVDHQALLSDIYFKRSN